MRVGASVDAQLEDVANRLALGEYELSECGTGIQALYVYAYSAGAKSQITKIERLTWERDLYYFLTCNPKMTGADYYKRLTDQLWISDAA